MKFYLIPLALFLLSSCNTLKTQPDSKEINPTSPQLENKASKTLGLLKQGAYYHQLTGKLYQSVCQQFLQIYTDKNSWQAGWLLAYSFSDKQSCITHKKRLAILKSLQKSKQLNTDIAWLNQSQIKTLQNIDRLKNKLTAYKNKNNKLQIEQQILQKKNKYLTAQIQALKLIENSINERISHDNKLSR